MTRPTGAPVDRTAMRHHTRVSAAALTVIVVAISARLADAQCAFEHPKKANKFQTSLTTAMFPCGGIYCGYCTPNSATEGGIPACEPPETFNQAAGSPPDGWTWDESKGSGQVLLKALKTFPTNPLNPPSNSADMLVQMKLSGVLSSNFGPGSGDGSLSLYLRMTWNDRMSGDVSVIDYPASFAFTMAGGKAKLKSTLDTLLNAPPTMQPGLPKCANIEVVGVGVQDPEFNTFATPGLFLP